jgi:NTE family protein
MSLGLALSGGGVRGAAHVGVLKAFEEYNIVPNYISGTSAGSIIAALYCAGYKASEIERMILSIDKSIIDYDIIGLLKFTIGILLKKKVKIDGFVKGDKLESLIYNLCESKGIVNIGSVKVHLAIPAVDINTSDLILFSSKRMKKEDGVFYDNKSKISEAVRASISFPGIFKPKIINNRRLVDGGVRDNVPIKVLKDMGADKVIAVNLGYCGEHDEYIDNILEITSQTIDIMAYSIFKFDSKNADYILKPRIYNVKLLEVERIPECIERGYNYTKKIIPDLKRSLGI